MEMPKKYDLIEYRCHNESSVKTYCLMTNLEPDVIRSFTTDNGNFNVYYAYAIETPLIGYQSSRVNIHEVIFSDMDVLKVIHNVATISFDSLANIEPFKERCEMLITFHKKVEEMKQKHGTVIYDGEEYILIQEAMFEVDGSDNPYYCARAIKEPDIEFNDTFPDEYGYIHAYEVQWDLKDEYYEDWKHRWECEDNGEPYDVNESKMYNADESDMCEWDTPCAVEDFDEMITVDGLDRWG